LKSQEFPSLRAADTLAHQDYANLRDADYCGTRRARDGRKIGSRLALVGQMGRLPNQLANQIPMFLALAGVEFRGWKP